MFKIPDLNVILLLNSNRLEETSVKVKSLNTFLPSETSCTLVDKTLYGTNEFLEYLNNTNNPKPDLVIQYGLNNGLLYDLDELDGIPFINNDMTIQDLFYNQRYMFVVLFEEIKAKIQELDVIKCMPSGIKIAKTKKDLEYIVNRCLTEPFGFDTETNFLNPFIKDPAPQMLCFSVAWLSDMDEGWCIPTNENLIKSGDCEYTLEEARVATEQCLFDSEQQSFIHNAAYDLPAVYELFSGRQPKNFTGCTMLLLNLYHHADKSCALKNNTKLIGLPAYKDPVKDWIFANSKKNDKKGFEDVPLDIIGPYAALDAIAVVRLVNFLKQNLATSLWKFYYKIPHKILKLSNELLIEGYELSGNRYYFSKLMLEKELKVAFDEAISTVSKHIPSDFNIGSPKQLSTLLFDKLKLPAFNKTAKGAVSTNQKTLNDLILFHPFIFKLNKLRKISKLYSSYVTGYKSCFNEGSRKCLSRYKWVINSTYKQINRTARLSASNMTGHLAGVSKTGGNILTLPASGTMIKHFFLPPRVVEVENELFDLLLKELEKKDPVKYAEVMEWTSFNGSSIIAPVLPPKPVKVLNANGKQSRAKKITLNKATIPTPPTVEIQEEEEEMELEENDTQSEL